MMSKNRKQQKKKEAEQLNLFEDLAKPVMTTTDGIGLATGTGVELLSALERQRILTENLLEEVIDYRNLNKAYQQVYKNGGASGVDKMKVEELGHWLAKHYRRLRESLLNEVYQPEPVKKAMIPKPNGGERMLGIPTVKDRLLQQAIGQILYLYYDPQFSSSSYGFRRGRNAHEAIEQSCAYVASGKEWVVDIDLEKFFDKVNHDRLLQRLSKGIGDKRLLRLIRRYLQAGIMSDGLVEQRTAGMPQGSPLSPLLSNIVLDELDKELEKRGHSFCRYADDCNIYVGSKKAGERVMKSLIKFIEDKLKLKVNRKKSGVRRCMEVTFLGYTILPGGNPRASDVSIKRLKDKIRETTKRNRGVKFEQVIKELNAVIIGWSNYFSLANRYLSDLRAIDGWMRRKLRCYRLKQLGRKYTIYKFLRGMRISEQPSWNVVMYSGGWWNMSRKQVVGKAMGIEWFAQMGLQSLFQRIQR